MNFIMQVHPLHFASSCTSFRDFIYFIELTHTADLAEWDDWIRWMSRLRWLKESNAVAGGEECDGRGRRMLWQKETKANHNFRYSIAASSALYIFWFLHQTTTLARTIAVGCGCISFDSYIKPQPSWWLTIRPACCISFDSYIKPQPINDCVFIK